MDTNVYDYIDNLDTEALGNQSEASSFTYELPEEGDCFVRLCDYIEVGDQVTQYLGKDKPPQRQVLLAFEILSPKYLIKDKNENVIAAPKISLMMMPMSQNSGSGFYNLFMQLRGKTQATHMAQLLGRKAWRAEIVHTKSKDGKKTYAGFKKGKSFTFAEATNMDENGDLVPIKVRPLVSEPRLFLYDHPSEEHWNALHIDGQSDSGKSKNWIQNLIINSTNFSSSKLARMLSKLDTVHDTVEKDIVKDSQPIDNSFDDLDDDIPF